MDGEPRGELGEPHEREVAGKLAEMALVASWELQGEDVSWGLALKRAGISPAVTAGVLQSLDMQ